MRPLIIVAALSLLATRASAEKLAAVESSFVWNKTIAAFVVAKCNAKIADSALRISAEKTGVDFVKFHDAVFAAIGANTPNESYDSKKLIPEVTREVLRVGKEFNVRYAYRDINHYPLGSFVVFNSDCERAIKDDSEAIQVDPKLEKRK